jgi:hypothetical protein
MDCEPTAPKEPKERMGVEGAVAGQSLSALRG